MRMERTIKVVAQKTDPQAEISKGQRGGFQTTVLNVLADGTERQYRVVSTRKKDLVAKLQKLPIENIRGMQVDVDRGFVSFELFTYNGV